MGKKAWTKETDRLLEANARKCTNKYQLAKAIGISYKTIQGNREYTERLETALMESWGEIGGEGLVVLRSLLRNAESEKVKLAAAAKLVDVAEKQKDRLEPTRLEISAEGTTGMGLVYEKFARISRLAEQGKASHAPDDEGES